MEAIDAALPQRSLAEQEALWQQVKASEKLVKDSGRSVEQSA
jgi:hypothetical protein